MAGYADNVVRYFREKGATGFDKPVTYIGAEQRNITALRNSANNNLEEQYILGTDAYTEIYNDIDGNVIIEKSFHINTVSPNNYYKIKTTIYKNTMLDSEYSFNGEEFLVPDDPNQIIFGDGSASYPYVDTLYGVMGNIFNFVEEAFQVYSTTYDIVRKDELFFITDNGNTITPVSMKVISRKYVKNGDNPDKVVFKEDITNYLS